MSPATTTVTSVMAPDGAERQKISALVTFLDRHPQPAGLVTSDGEQVEVPAQLFEALRQIAAILAQGDGVAINAISRELSTTEASRILGMSRPTLIRLLDAEELPSHRVGSHRRVLLHDVLTHRRQQIRERRKEYEELMLESDALGLTTDD
jgi:excisionase family DNA binding protein